MFKTIRFVERDIYSGILKLHATIEIQINLNNKNDKFKGFTKTKRPDKIENKELILKTRLDFSKEEKKFLMVLKVKAGHMSENLINEIREIIYSLYWTTEITKKVYSRFKATNAYYIYEFWRF